ncbi:MAG: hypothetical protein CM15mP4_1090 [Candidatus Neomarinimicrobiota bacterium]|nr:MAG: hypothetical protein CM15mP4_1090 [Candidatus Neomarinimicrobiota bacterium]
MKKRINTIYMERIDPDEHVLNYNLRSVEKCLLGYHSNQNEDLLVGSFCRFDIMFRIL